MPDPLTDDTTDPPHTRVPRAGVSVRVRIISTMLLLVLVALASAGAIVYVVELGRIDTVVQAGVEQELAELDRLQRDGVNPQTLQPFTSAEEVLTTFISRNVPHAAEILVGWWDGQAQKRSQDTDQVTADLRPTSALHRQLEPLVRKGRSARIDAPGHGDVLVTVQPVVRGGETASLVMLTFLDPARAGLRDTMRSYAVVSALALLVIGLGVTWQAGRLLSPLRDLHRTAERVNALDLTERLPERGNDDLTALTRTFNDMLDRLESSFAAQRRFLDDAGHELRTPLTVLSGHLELLDPNDADDVAATRALLLEEVGRMGRLVEDLILLAKARRPDFVRPHATDVGDLTRSVLAKARGMAEREWLLDDVAEVIATLDEQRITQALLQLVDNAVKHTDPGDAVAVGSAVRSRTEQGSDLVLWVRDTGDGVDPTRRDDIFGRFQRAGVRAADEGFGLGLSIVAAIASASGGSVHVEDPAPQPPGSRFVLTLPLTDSPEDPWPRS